MRVEVNDEADRLRRRVRPIRCADDTDYGSRASDPRPAAVQECHDCGRGMESCRCHPGEG
jgi:hypothetical protein